ncbi:aspartyl-tRNA(Asn)/glutamyl-tRNA(Gln) amidotransferase subunit A [Brevibacterium paucivorans]|uniref:Aspartyl-tRNA(Asn)/glutamyl-tRNA(Gln) amidotransferase subunit A n=1 Tax=Brevibacterium paucivorans TaxID=170994 RepID=A0ABS2SLD9_9MICO|nr:aspartyl-tRNA(Asn)/glutamyl-tRNA(Gln) amidotransferase subunit A [Brevibacterium paucivorans]
MNTELSTRATELNAVTAFLNPSTDPQTSQSTNAHTKQPGPLAGLTFAVKDVIDVAGVPTSMGSNVTVPGTQPATTSAPIVSQLTELGAVAVAKTNCQEFSHGILGDASAFGRVINPVDPALCTGGSSSGSAALVGAGVVDVALGTDTAGSVRVPAACCHVTGFKPTFGVLPVDGIFPLSPTFDTAGLFAREPATVARVFSALTGREAPPAPDQPRIGFVDARGTIRAVTGNLPDAHNLTTSGEELCTRAAHIYDVVRKFESAQVHRDLMNTQAHDYQPQVLAKFKDALDVSEEEYQQGLTQVRSLQDEAAEVFASVDFIVTPAVDGPLATWELADSDPGVRGAYMHYSQPFNVVGWPAVVVPWHTTDSAGYPQSIQIVAHPGKDAELLTFAMAFAGAGN